MPPLQSIFLHLLYKYIHVWYMQHMYIMLIWARIVVMVTYKIDDDDDEL